MVEAARAQNPFATQAGQTDQLDITNFCPHMTRLGVCLEPQMCFLIHKVSTAEVPEQMTTQAKAFNPFAAAAGTPVTVKTKEFLPGQEQEQTAQTGIISMLGRMGMEAQVDPELGTIFIQQFESCSCCHGLINNCRGELCENLGMCFCVSDAFHQD